MNSPLAALRVGVVQSGRLVEERVVSERSISVGSAASSTMIVPCDGAPARWRLFERRQGRYQVRLAPSMHGLLAAGGQVVPLRPDGGRALVLPARARGRITMGEVVILFQIVRAPAGPRTQLPRALMRSTMRELDRPFAVLAGLSLLAHAAMVLYLQRVDWPRQPVVEEVPDVFVRTVLRRPPPPPAPAQPPRSQPKAQPTPAPARRTASVAARPSLEAQRQKLVARVGRIGILPVIASLGASGAVRDLLSHGSVDRDQERALREVGGLMVAQGGTSLPLGAAPTGGGRIADVGALVGRAHISTADVGGSRAERRVSVVRAEPPAFDEEVAGFDPQLIARAIRARLAEVRACYERALKRRPDIGGRLLLRFTLTPAGTVASVDVDEDTLGDSDVTACVRAVVGLWRFPAPPRKVEVNFPFVFQPAS